MIQDLIAATELQMRAKLAEARAKFQHKGLKGDAVEDAVALLHKASLRRVTPNPSRSYATVTV